MNRHRTESQATTRLRSNSSLTAQSVEADEFIDHPVESRTRTAELPPVMVGPIQHARITPSDNCGYSLKVSTMTHFAGLDLKKTVSSPHALKVCQSARGRYCHSHDELANQMNV